MERCRLDLRYGLHLAEHLRRRSLIEVDRGIDRADCLEQIQAAEPGDVGRRHRLIEGDADEALRGKVVDLGRVALFQQTGRRTQVRQIELREVQILMSIYA